MNLQEQLTKLAADHYDAALATGKRFTITDLVESLTADLLDRITDDRSAARDLIAYSARTAVERVDKSRTAPEPEATLLDLLDQPVAVAAGARITRRRMTLGDWAAHLGHIGENVSRVNASAAKENARFSILAPFFGTSGDTEKAMKTWRKANPDAVLP